MDSVVVKTENDGTPYINYLYDAATWGANSSSYLYEMLPTVNWSGYNLFSNMEIDFIENSENFIINIDLPGIDRQNISVELTTGIITVTAERVEVPGTIYHSKRISGKCKRTINVPKNTRETDIAVKYSKGVLSIVVEKYDDVPRKLEIQ